MKRVVFLMTIQGADFSYHRGEEVELEDAMARSYKAQGIVKYLDPVVAEAATLPQAENSAEAAPVVVSKPKPKRNGKKSG